MRSDDDAQSARSRTGAARRTSLQFDGVIRDAPAAVWRRAIVTQHSPPTHATHRDADAQRHEAWFARGRSARRDEPLERVRRVRSSQAATARALFAMAITERGAALFV